MKKRILSFVCVVACLFAAGCMRQPEEGPGGLNLDDFKQIALNGFDPVDQAEDHNDYPWSMEYYEADGKVGDGYIYVGTWNRVQQWKGFQEHLPVYPEIRRYRPDQGPTAWETVLDIRDYNMPDDERTHGFRFLKSYRNQSDGKLYLYASGRGPRSDLWRSETGEPGTWELFYTYPREGSFRGLTVHNGLLYMAYLNDYALLGSDGGPEAVILATDGSLANTQVINDTGFGNPNNTGIFTLGSFNGWLYAGTHNQREGCEVWKLEGPNRTASPVKIFTKGGPRSLNEAAMTMYVYKDNLYIGTISNFIWRMIGGLKPADLIRVHADDSWEAITGKNSPGGEASGFGERGNAYMWSLEEHDGWLYCGTYDIVTGMTFMFTHFDYLASMMGLGKSEPGAKRFSTVFDLLTMQSSSGGDLYKSQDGENWYCVMADGFGDHNNYGLRCMRSAKGQLFIGLSNPYDGLEVWAGGIAD